MNKTKLAICMQDLEYQTRFVNCFMNHYNHQYELHVFTQLEQLELSAPKEYAVIITGEYTMNEMKIFVERGEILLHLADHFEETADSTQNTIICTEKYQEVYKIAEMIERIVADKIQISGSFSRKESLDCIGIYSLTQERLQAPFSALLGMIYGERQKVLILDLQPYSGLIEVDEGMNSMGLEDLLSVAMSGNYSRGRVLECIRHEANWDYISSVQNNQCLAEGTKESYRSMIEFLVQKLGYEKIIFNFGTMFLGQLDLMEECQTVYFLSEREEENWREHNFFHEMMRQGNENLMKRIKKIELPPIAKHEGKWRNMVEKWSWSHIGELIRQEVQKEKSHGAVV